MGGQPAGQLRGPKVSANPLQRGSTVHSEETNSPLPHAVARLLVLGRRESLTIAGELGVSVAAVNDALLRMRERCHGCIRLQQPNGSDPRFIVVVEEWEPLKRLAWGQD